MSKTLSFKASISCLAVLFFLCFVSCAAPSRIIVVSSPQVAKIKRIAILPFSSISERTSANETVTSIFVTEMFNLGKYYVEEPGNVLEFMIKERMNILGEIDAENLKIMSERLGVDAVIVGTVEEYDDGLTMFPPVPVVSITARMVEPGSGKIIWSAKNKRSGEDYAGAFGVGRVSSITTLTKRVVNEMIGSIVY